MNTHQMTDSQAESRKQLIAEQAAEWLVCLRDQHLSQDDHFPNSAARNKAFFDWVKESPAHLLLFMEMAELERRLNRLDEKTLTSIRDLLVDIKSGAASATGRVRNDCPIPSANEPDFRYSRSRRWLPIGIAAAAACVGVGVMYLSPSQAEVYTTPIGQQQVHRLRDGSSITLNTDTRVEVTFSNTARSVKMVRGEAYFSVNPDYRRPFIVLSGGARIQDVGTEFSVRLRNGSDTVISVVSGTVKVGPGVTTNRDGDVALGAGKAAEVIDNRVVEVSEKDARSATAWLKGTLIFDKRRLEEAVAEFNRYSPNQILIEGSGLQDIPVTGMFKTDRYDDFISYVRALPSVSMDSEGERWVIRPKK
jgi:transmembrane sensor